MSIINEEPLDIDYKWRNLRTENKAALKLANKAWTDCV